MSFSVFNKISFVFKFSSVFQSEDATDNSSSASRRDSTVSTSSNQSHNVQQMSEGLPAGWSIQVAPNGRWFFINHNDRSTSWVDPRTGRASPMPNQTTVPVSSHKPDDNLGPLPEGWEERVHSDGRIFFIDHSECCLNIMMKKHFFDVMF